MERTVSGLGTSRSLICFMQMMCWCFQDMTFQRALGWFAAKCEAAGISVVSSMSETIALNWKPVKCSLRVEGEAASGGGVQVSGPLTGNGSTHLFSVIRALLQSIVVKKEFSRGAKLLIYRPVTFQPSPVVTRFGSQPKERDPGYNQLE